LLKDKNFFKEVFMSYYTSVEEEIEEWDWDRAIPTGKSIKRSLSYKYGIAHEGVHLWIIRENSGLPEILFQHRAAHKKLYPDCLDITVAGHVPFGLKEHKINKEAMEELGIYLDESKLFDLGYIRFEEKTDEYHHREFQHVYLMKDNRPLGEYRFNDGEVVGIYAVPLNFLKELFYRDFNFEVDGYDGKGAIRRLLSRKDFHPLLFMESMNLYMETLFKAIDELFTKGSVDVRFPSIRGDAL